MRHRSIQGKISTEEWKTYDTCERNAAPRSEISTMPPRRRFTGDQQNRVAATILRLFPDRLAGCDFGERLALARSAGRHARSRKHVKERQRKIFKFNSDTGLRIVHNQGLERRNLEHRNLEHHILEHRILEHRILEHRNLEHHILEHPCLAFRLHEQR